MNRDAVGSASRTVFAVGLAVAVGAASPAVAAAPATGGVVPSASTAPAEDRAATTPKASARPKIRVTVARGVGLVGNRAVYAGRVIGAKPGDRVRLDVRGTKSWVPVDTGKIGKNGQFRVVKEIATVGDRLARVRVLSSAHAGTIQRRVKRVHGFRKSHASYFGPGLFGSALACGGRLTPSTKGVAHKTLPCGTRVTLRYGSRQVTTKVVDRGPYIAGREWDLTAATRNQLGFGDVGQVWVDR